MPPPGMIKDYIDMKILPAEVFLHSMFYYSCYTQLKFANKLYFLRLKKLLAFEAFYHLPKRKADKGEKGSDNKITSRKRIREEEVKIF